MEDIYDSNFICTYIAVDDDDLYRAQFLQAFKMKKWDDLEITRRTDIIFNISEKHFIDAFDILREGKSKFAHIMLFMGDKLTNENLFRIFFVYDLFEYTHRCLCDIVLKNKIDQKHLSSLLDVLHNSK